MTVRSSHSDIAGRARKPSMDAAIQPVTDLQNELSPM
jgi:hypothetical protein